MKILVMSDTHMENQYMHEITSLYEGKVDLMIHCGDISLPEDDPLLAPFDIKVKGNHDFDNRYPLMVTYNNILVSHGHRTDVYENYDTLTRLAKENGCNIVLHGHTHVPTLEESDGIHFVNPGSVMINRGSYAFGTYVVLQTDPFEAHFYHHQTHEMVDDIVIEEGRRTLAEFKELIKGFRNKKSR